ncbi:MAG: beta-lactamase family protein [Anaerolineae bacterium]|nr:beta-lactamase family protein [Anaerolineae bacterium]
MNTHPVFNLRWLSVWLGLTLGAMLVVIAAAPIETLAAEAPDIRLSAVEATSSDLSDPQDLEAFIDGIMTAQLDAHQIPGAVVAVVKDGELFFAKGYGYADLAALKPVKADQTLFHPGSVSKLFTWTAVMQLVEQGKLDLDTDVNTYLDFTIPATYPEPVTLRNLMTHTPGFEDKGIGIFAASAEDLIPLGKFLADNVPARVYPPGETTAYSNYGTALAGYIVERVSGVSFEQYIEDTIFQPLDMQHSTFRQRDFPSDLAEDVSMGYTYANGVSKAGNPEYVQVFPAGSLSSTATDMANFMIAYLQGGQYGEGCILQEATVQEMHRQQFTNDPQTTGIGLGFYELRADNPRIVGHEGDTMYFHSLLGLISEHNVGLFVSYNSGGESGMRAMFARRDVLDAFLARYYPVEETPVPAPPTDFLARAGRFAGAYGSSRSNYTSAEKVIGLFQPLSVSPLPDGTLLASYGPIQMQLVEVEPLKFQNIEDGSWVVFSEDENGQITAVMVDWDPTEKFIKLPWYASPSVHMPVLILCLMLFLVGVIGWSIRLVEERGQAKASGEPRPLLPRLARWVGIVTGALNVIFAVAITGLFMSVSANPVGIPPAMIAVMVIPVVTALLTLGMVVCSVLAWKDRYWRFGGRLFYTLTTLAGVLFIVLVNYWHLWVIGQG